MSEAKQGATDTDRTMMSRRAFVLGAGAALLVAACGGDSDGRVLRPPSDDTTVPVDATETTLPPTTTTTEAPTTTTEVPVVKEIGPGQPMGFIKVQISGQGALQSEITQLLHADVRTPEEFAAKLPVDIERSNDILDYGFMFHRDTYMPHWRENVVVPENPSFKYPTVIAGHRSTDIPNSPFGERVLMDIDKILPGDTLQLFVEDNASVIYTAGEHMKVFANDETTIDNIFFTTSTTPRLVLYACDTSNPAGVPEDGTYTPDMRYFVIYEQQG